MQKVGRVLGEARADYVIPFLLIGILGLLNWFGAEQRFFLNCYFLPVVLEVEERQQPGPLRLEATGGAREPPQGFSGHVLHPRARTA